jgi:hypothetical protein
MKIRNNFIPEFFKNISEQTLENLTDILTELELMCDV